MSSFVHLNVHSPFSILMGLCKLKPLVKQAKEHGATALGLCDNTNMFGALEFHKACEAEELRPIVGMSVLVAQDRKKHEPQEVKVGRRLNLYAKNLEGYRSLCRISSQAYTEGFYFRPRVDRELIEEHREGILILSGGQGSEVNDYILRGQHEKAQEAIEFYRDLVGEEDYFLELQRTGIPDLKTVESELIAFSRELGVSLVATNDVYYLDREAALAHEGLMCIGQQKTLNDHNHPKFSSDDFYLKSPSEMEKLFSDLPEALENTTKVAERCDLVFPKKTYHLPLYEPPEGLDVETYFDRACMEGLIQRYGKPLSQEVLDRYEIEKQVILSTGFPTYFLIVADFISAAREMDIPVGPGRGSAAGSLIAYALEITDIDPLRFDLLFERFLNADRISMPDIDIDFCMERRQEVIDYVVRKYGSEKVAMIATFLTLGPKAVVRDIGRVLSVPLREVDRICKMIPDDPRIRSLGQAQEANVEFKNFVRDNEETKELFRLGQQLEGTVRGVGKHAAGVVIADKALTEYLPLIVTDGVRSTQYTMNSVEEDCGLLKMDFLGLQNLTVIHKAVQLIKSTRGEELEMRKLPLDDPAAYEILQRGETMGVFQFESEGMRALLRKAKPDVFEDIIALLALFRPGPLGSGMDEVFVECKHGRRDIEYPHELCESELAETYGVILYQEQVMRLANKLADFNLREADTLRKAMGKKQIDKMLKFKPKFIEGAKSKKIDEEVATRIWDMMEKFAEYGFNKSHSTAYAYVSYQTAYLKARYSEEFMAALMTCDIHKKDKIARLREECRRMGIEVYPPHVNESNYDFAVVEGKIRYGLGGAKGVGKPSVDAILEARESGGSFKHIEDFVDRVDLSRCGKTAIEALIRCGAFDDLGATRCQMFVGLPEVMQMAQSERRKLEQGQMALFTVEAVDDKVSHLPDLPEWPEREKLAREKEVLGFFVSSHPLVTVEDTLRYFSSHSIAELSDLEEKSEVCLGGMVSQRGHRFFGDNRKLIRFQLEDLSSTIDCVYFCQEQDRFEEMIQDDEILFIVGRKKLGFDGQPSVTASKVFLLNQAESSLSSSISLHLQREMARDDLLNRVKALLQTSKGRVPVYLSLGGEQGVMQFKLGQEFAVDPRASLLTELGDLLGRDNVEVRKYQKSLLGGRKW